jgi:hypothetical protein
VSSRLNKFIGGSIGNIDTDHSPCMLRLPLMMQAHQMTS